MDCTCILLGLPCECPRRGRGRPAFRPHGTMAAVRRHYRHKAPLCRACRQAQERDWADSGRDRRRQRQQRKAVAA